MKTHLISVIVRLKWNRFVYHMNAAVMSFLVLTFIGIKDEYIDNVPC